MTKVVRTPVKMAFAAVLLAGCATMSGDVSREAALERELSGRTAGQSVDCIDVAGGQSLDIVSDTKLVLRRPDTIWVARLPAACPGMRPLDQLVIEPTSSGRYCRNDRFRALQPGSPIAGPTCRFGPFTPYRRP